VAEISGMKIEKLETSDPKAHAANIEKGLSELIEHMRSDVDRVNEPKAQVLFETGAEVLIGVRTAFEHYRTAAEKAMR
jgi:hypothetical protein